MPFIPASLQLGLTSRLSRQLSLWVLVGILGIEAIIFLPSAYRRKEEQLNAIAMTSIATLKTLETTSPRWLEFSENLPNLKQNAKLIAGAMYRLDGTLVKKFGDSKSLNFSQSQSKFNKLSYDNSWRYDISSSVIIDSNEYCLILSYDADGVFQDLISFSLRVIGLVVLISLSVTLLMIWIINNRLIYPILKLQEDICQSGKAIAQGQPILNFESLQYTTQNELQEVIQAFYKTYGDIVIAIEQQKQSEDQLKLTLIDLQSTQAQLIHTEKMSSLGKLGAGFAHEINNPINFIYANLDYVTQHSQDLLEVITQYQREFPNTSPKLQGTIEEYDLEFIQKDLPIMLRSMKSGSSRIRDLVSSFRNFIRLDESEIKQVDIHIGIESTLALLQSTLEGNKFRSAIDIDRHYGRLPEVSCHPSQLNQVFLYLISNAIEAIDQLAEIESKVYNIKILTKAIDRKIIISISDNGIGIESSIAAKIFDPFFTTKDVGEGAGLGLTNSHHIITKIHQGTLTLESQPKQGSTFTISIDLN